MAKNQTLFLCDSCGNEFTKWAGQCPACNAWNSLKELNLQSLNPQKNNKNSPRTKSIFKPSEALKNAEHNSFPTNIPELDRVLGKGITQGGVYLISGQPGIGKSTLLSQLALSQSQNKRHVYYVCSEENAAQVATRLTRLGSITDTHLHLIETSSLEDTLSSINTNGSDSLLIVDSIQSIFTNQANTLAGSLTQIKACTHLLISYAKSQNLPVIIVGHVNKDGKLAGPKLLEHMVDVVLELEGDRHHDLRLLRGIKNRFGPTDETGLFQMISTGLNSIDNPGKLFLNDQTNNQPGSCLTLIMEGTRPLLVEVQALTVHTELPIPRRVAQGIPITKLQLICAILTKHLKLKLNEKDVFVNITGGLRVTDPAADLAIAIAILTSYKNIPSNQNQLIYGELGLLGEIRPVAYKDKRDKEAKNLGYEPTDSRHKNIKNYL